MSFREVGPVVSFSFLSAEAVESTSMSARRYDEGGVLRQRRGAAMRGE